MNKFANSVVAITGASSGIGKALALEISKQGGSVAISDKNADSLEQTASDCRSAGAKGVLATTVDVSKRSQMQAWADEVQQHFGKVNVIINNAGVNLSACVEKMSYKDFEWVMDIDFWGVVYGSKSFLPHIKNSDWGHIVNMSSLFGLIGIPNQSAYNAAKFAVRGFSESLRMELEMDGNHVGVSSVHPGGVKTNIVNCAVIKETLGRQVSPDVMKKQFNEKLARTSPEQAAKDILRGIEKNKPRILVGMDARIGDRMQRLMPTGYQKLVKLMFS
jgi:short-subunit dehydrogenase